MPSPSSDRAPILAASQTSLRRAADALRGGRLVAFPTETVYGLGADATDGAAIAALFAAKGRPAHNPLIVHAATVRAALDLIVPDPRAEMLAQAFWPGPLTLVGRRRPGCKVVTAVSAGLPTLALRVPGLPLARDLLALTGRPIAAPSANRSGHVSPTTAAHVAADLGNRIALILASGRARIGLESTVVALRESGVHLLRAGAVTPQALEDILGPLVIAEVDGREHHPQSPGRLAAHYAPSLPVRLEVLAPEPGEAYLAFGPSLRHGPHVRNLSDGGDLEEAAANLYAYLRDLDSARFSGIAVAPIPRDGLGLAINDRLGRAAGAARMGAEEGCP